MGTVRLTMAQALVRFLCAQMTEVEGREAPLFGGVWAIFGHGNVAGLGEALHARPGRLPTLRAHNEQAMAHAAIAYAKAHARRRMMACTTSIGPGATNMVTAAAVAHVNRLPVLLLPGDVFANRIPDPVLQQVEDFGDPTISANDCFRPVSRYWDRIMRPEQLLQSLPAAHRVLTDPADCGPVTLALPQDVQAEAFDYPERLLRAARAPAPAPGARSRPARAAAAAASTAPSGRSSSPAAASTTPLAEPALAPSPSATASRSRETQAGKGSLPWDHPLPRRRDRRAPARPPPTRSPPTPTSSSRVGTRLADFPRAPAPCSRAGRRPGGAQRRPASTPASTVRCRWSPTRARARGAVGGARRLAGARRPDGDGAPTQRRVERGWSTPPPQRRGRRADRGAGHRRGEPRGRPARRGRVRRRRAARRAAQALAHARPARLPPRVRLLLHGLRDRRRAGREARACPTARSSSWSATAAT